MFRTRYYITKEGLSFLKYEGLCDLQQSNGIQLAGENCKSNNARKIFISSIASSIKGDQQQDFNKAPFIIIMSDGSTDKGLLSLML